MPFDFKKEYKQFYQPKAQPSLVDVPPVNYIAVRGQGDPNQEGGAYQRAIPLLYAVACTLKMSKKTDYRMDGYFDFVVPPLEGFWRQEGVDGVDYSRKQDFRFLSVIRMPDFVTEEDVRWAKEEASRKKKLDCSSVSFLSVTEGLCVQCLHLGPYDNEPATVERMNAFLDQEGYVTDFSPQRLHHEIYLSDARKTAPEKLRTVIRHPVRRR